MRRIGRKIDLKNYDVSFLYIYVISIRKRQDNMAGPDWIL